jgi:hypothetical protein
LDFSGWHLTLKPMTSIFSLLRVDPDFTPVGSKVKMWIDP